MPKSATDVMENNVWLFIRHEWYTIKQIYEEDSNAMLIDPNLSQMCYTKQEKERENYERSVQKKVVFPNKISIILWICLSNKKTDILHIDFFKSIYTLSFTLVKSNLR